MRAHPLFSILIISFALLFVALAQAASYPTHPIRLIVPYAPGGGADSVARIEGGAEAIGGAGKDNGGVA